jgi:hypothetical protein
LRAARLALLIGSVSCLPAAADAQTAPDSAMQATLPTAFVRRSARKGGGKFLTAADVQKIHASDTPQLLVRVTGGDLRDVGNGDMALVNRRGIRQTFSAPIENELCRIGIVINDRVAPDGFDLKSIAIGEIVAIEFYSGPATIPPDLNNTTGDAGRCGLAVVWVKGR